MLWNKNQITSLVRFIYNITYKTDEFAFLSDHLVWFEIGPSYIYLRGQTV